VAEKNLHPKTLATASCLIAVGTYTQPMPHVHGIGLGIHLLRFDAATATLRELLVSRRSRNPSYFCHSARHGLLYSVSELDEEPSLDVYAIDDAATLRHLCNVPTPGASPCHVSLNPAANHLYISNYGSGELLCYRLDERGLPLPEPTIIVRHGAGPRRDRQSGPHMHCALPSPAGDSVYCCDLGTDTLARHAVRGSDLALTPDLLIQAEPGSGPRHFQLDRPGAHVFVLNELSNSATMHKLPTDDDASPHALAHVSTLPPGWHGSNTAAALRLHPNGRWLYASNRGHDSIAGFRVLDRAPWLEPMGWWPAGGRTPRDAAITPDGAYLLVASQDEHCISCYLIDPDDGQLHVAGTPYAIASPACLLPLFQTET